MWGWCFLIQDNTVFLAPAPQRAPVEPEVNLPPPQPIPARPLGY